MPAQIVFLTLFLGIASGTQQVAVDVSGPVKMVRILLGGREVAVLTQPPWRALVQLGAELTPRELTAVGFDDAGREIARVTQVLNLPRPTAEFEIMLDGDEVSLHWRHLTHAKATGGTMMLDGRPLPLDPSLRAHLPKIDREQTHVLSAEMRFADGFVARRELVIESERSASVGTELTPIVVRETAPKHPAGWDGCLAAPDGTPVRVAAVEKGPAAVVMVRNPDRREISRVFSSARGNVPLDMSTVERVMWPVAERLSSGDDTSVLFGRSADFSGPNAGLLFLMLLNYVGPSGGNRREFADAVAVAGIQAVTAAQRRAVVLVLSAAPDESTHRPGAVRRYLGSLGVPLFVWSVTGPRPDLADSWGPVDDVSNLGKLNDATIRLRTALDQQRVAWVDADPLTALRLKASERCGIETVARIPP